MLHSRLERVAAQVKAELARIIDQKLKDPRVPAFVTIHSVRLARDLRVADVYFTFLNDDETETQREAEEGLNQSAGFIRGELGRVIRLKYLPALRFHYNPSTHYAADLEKLFHQIERPEPADAAESGSGEDDR